MSPRMIWWLPMVIVFGAISIVLSEHGTLDPVQNLSLTISAPLQQVLHDAGRPASNLFTDIVKSGSVAGENRQLREQIELLNKEIAEHQDLEQRIRELESAVGVKQSRPEEQLVPANVIAEDTSGLKRFVAIDLGVSDGIDEGMVVLSRNGSLVGSVSRAYQNSAWIRLITDPDSAINAQIDIAAPTPVSAATPAPAAPGVTSTASPVATATPPPAEPVRLIAQGDLRERVVLELLPSDAPVAEGALVLTSGHGGNYPRGLLIGSVKSVEQRPQSPFKRANVEPAANLSGLDTLLVLTSFKPARLSAP